MGAFRVKSSDVVAQGAGVEVGGADIGIRDSGCCGGAEKKPAKAGHVGGKLVYGGL